MFCSLKNSLRLFNVRYYTCILERYNQPNLVKKGVDIRKLKLKSSHYHYKFVDCLHSKKWGDMKLILTQFVEGIGHKGELVEVSRHMAHYELLPAKLAVFPTDENLKFYKSDTLSIEQKSKVSKFAAKTKEILNSMLLQIPMNLTANWTLNKDIVRIALRYNNVISKNENLTLPENFEEIKCNNRSYYKEEFFVEIKINDYTTAKLRCKIVPIDKNKLWEAFSIYNKNAQH